MNIFLNKKCPFGHYFIGGKQSPPDFGQHAKMVLPMSLNISSPQQPYLFGFVPSAQSPDSIFSIRCSSVNSGAGSVEDAGAASSTDTAIGGKQSPPVSGQQLNPSSPMSVYFSPGQQPFLSGVSHVLSVSVSLSVFDSDSSDYRGKLRAFLAATPRAPARF